MLKKLNILFFFLLISSGIYAQTLPTFLSVVENIPPHERHDYLLSLGENGDWTRNGNHWRAVYRNNQGNIVTVDVTPCYIDKDNDLYQDGNEFILLFLGYGNGITGSDSPYYNTTHNSNYQLSDAYGNLYNESYSTGVYSYNGNNWISGGLGQDCDDNNASTPTGLSIFFEDLDGDGYGSTFATARPIECPNGTYNYVTNNEDCYDANASITTQPVNWYLDSDDDGYGDPNIFIVSCRPPSLPGSPKYVINGDDCNDQDPRYNVEQIIWYADFDNDGFGDETDAITSPCPVANYITNCYFDECPTEAGKRTNGCPIEGFDFDNETQNYTYNRTYTNPYKPEELVNVKEHEVIENINYYDGLGRTKQSIAIKAGGLVDTPQTNALVFDWKVGESSSSFYKNIGQDSENEIIEGLTPFNTTDLIWECGNDVDNDADGGWNTSFQGVDKTKGYRYTTWVKREGDLLNGKVYHGTKNVNNLDGTPNGNPYFFSGNLPQSDTWYLLVGVVHPYNYTGGDTGESGVYDMQGNKVLLGNEYKWRADTTVSYFRDYLYYSTDPNVRQYFWNPLLQQINTDAYTIPQILSLQEIQYNSSIQDIVTPFMYNFNARQTKGYLPTPSNTLGNFTDNDLVIAEGQDYYAQAYASDFNGVINSYSEKDIEASPLSRVLEQGAPGHSWMVNDASDTDHTIKFNYETNATNEVLKFTVAFTNGNIETPELSYSGYYAANQLYKNILKDENWQPNQAHPKDHTIEKFKDNTGQVVLKRTYNTTETLDTYYIYDDFGNLTYVLSPKGVDAIVANNNTITQTILDDLGYLYKYDYKNRLIEKKVSGKGWEYIVYDDLDRPVLTQDANQRESTPKEWSFIKYETYSRVAYTGIYSSNDDRATIQNSVNSQTSATNSVLYETRETTQTLLNDDPTTVLYYSNHVFPNDSYKVLTISYYDDYKWGTLDNFEPSYSLNLSSGANQTGTSITKTTPLSSWNEGFTSQSNITNDGYIQFTVNQLGKRQILGLSQENTTPTNNGIGALDFGIYLYGINNRVYIYEDGISQPIPTTYFEIGDEFKVERVGTQILYKKNNTVIHSSLEESIGNLKGKGSFFDYNTSIDNVFIGYSHSGEAFNFNTKGAATGIKIRTLETNLWATTAMYYDDKFRSIYATSTNNYLNVKESVGSQLDFVGRLLKTKKSHQIDNNAPIITESTLTYDKMGRLLREEQQINSHNKELITKNSYNTIGQLTEKQIGGELLELSTYTNSIGMEVIGNTITKTTANGNGWNSGLSTVETISNDGYLSYTILQANKATMIGLSYTDVDQGYANINYAIYNTIGGTVFIYESGINKGQKTTYVPNDSFSIERRSNTVYYLKNGEVFYVSDVPTTNTTLLGDLSMVYPETKIKDLVLVDLDKGLQDVDYKYNIRGWLKEINDIDNIGNDLFAFQLGYNTSKTGSTTLYNGNISESIWKTNNESDTRRAYSYSYDALNRIKEAQYKENTFANLYFPLQFKYYLSNISYDKNGNLLSLNRDGAANESRIDQLAYTYDAGNKLTAVEDLVASVKGFNDGNKVGDDYAYNTNGSIIEDKNKGITSITYNHLNLPTEIILNNNANTKIEYTYNALGVKLEKKVSFSSTSTTTTQYVGNVIYKVDNTGRALQFVKQTEGYIEPNGNDFNYVYQYKDHLGNIRLSYSDYDGDGAIDLTRGGNDIDGDGDYQNEIVEENNYYPFGLKHEGYNDVVSAFNKAQSWKYNGTELEESFNINVYEMSFRQYDPAIGRWNVIDPVTHFSMSPYNAFDNNPVYWRDPSGADSEGMNGPPDRPGEYDGETHYDEETGNGYVWDGQNWHSDMAGGLDLDPSVIHGTNRNKSSGDGDGDGDYEEEDDDNIIDDIIDGFKEDPVGSTMKGVNLGVGAVSAQVTYKAKYHVSNERFHRAPDGRKYSHKDKNFNKKKIKKVRAYQTKALEKTRKLSNKLTRAGGILIGADILLSGEVKLSHVINGAFTAAATTGWGAPIAAIWFLADFATMGVNYLITGEAKGIGDMIDDKVGTFEMYEGLY